MDLWVRYSVHVLGGGGGGGGTSPCPLASKTHSGCEVFAWPCISMLCILYLYVYIEFMDSTQALA